MCDEGSGMQGRKAWLFPPFRGFFHFKDNNSKWYLSNSALHMHHTEPKLKHLSPDQCTPPYSEHSQLRLCQIQNLYSAFSPFSPIFALWYNSRHTVPRFLRAIHVYKVPSTDNAFPQNDCSLFLLSCLPCCWRRRSRWQLW